MDKKLLDLYTDYLMTATSLVSATGLSEILDNQIQISHDKITRFLSSGDFTSKDLWNKVKPVVRKLEAEDGAWQRFVRNPNLKSHNLVKLMSTAI